MLMVVFAGVILLLLGGFYVHSIQHARRAYQMNVERVMSQLQALQHIADGFLQEKLWSFEHIASSNNRVMKCLDSGPGETAEQEERDVKVTAVGKYFRDMILGQGSHYHFSALGLYNRQGQSLVHVGLPFFWSREKKISVDPEVQVRSEESFGDYLLLIARIDRDGEQIGTLVGSIALESWFEHLFCYEQTDNLLPESMTLLLVGPTGVYPTDVVPDISNAVLDRLAESQAIFRPDTAVLLPDKVDGRQVFVIRHARDIDLTFVLLVDSKVLESVFQNIGVHVFMSLALLFIVLSFLFSMRMQSRSSVFGTKLANMYRTNALINSLNQQLSREMKEKQRIAEALAAREVLLLNIVNSTPDMIFYMNSELGLVDCNTAFKTFFHLTDDNRPDTDTANITQFFPFLTEYCRAVLLNGKVVQVEKVVVDAAGGKLLFNCQISPIHLRNGTPPDLLGVVRNITEVQRMAEEIRRHEERLTVILDKISIGFISVCTKTGKTMVRRIRELLGYSSPKFECLSFQEFMELVHTEDRDSLQKQLQACLEEENGYLHYEFRMRHSDDRWLWILASGRMVCSTMGRGKDRFMAVLIDIDRRKQAELELRDVNITLEQRIAERSQELSVAYSRLMQQEKMVALGQLAAGIAHELNNPVNFIQINFTTLQDYLADIIELLGMYRALTGAYPAEEQPSASAAIQDREQQMGLADILSDIPALFTETEKGFERISHIVGAMRNFSRQGEGIEMEEMDVNQCITDTLILAHNEYKYVADVKTRLSLLPYIPGVASLLNQVFLNLIVNAAHAVRDNHSGERGSIIIETWHDQEHVHCTVRDDGPGIAEEHLCQLFEPFFTTKEPGQGTGLGLSISYDVVVNKHNGSLTAANHPDGGAVFTVSLPLQQPGQ